ncbi:hypothetical protein M4D51_02610 [Microbacterium sp. p3-SID338]|uniref:hypothetical protein n=1 Tax=Microbacterium sp. p3-SID338 TaxID=2916214 RepID=UPI0021A49EA3|nr:hypothetical protein [Microbacterium sp. p3-SID338]MCT1394610.1 hypothetical protein [Microbacterium sp. p3-SID338]
MRRVWGRELAGWAAALALALLAVGRLTSSPRSALMFDDGDSLIVALVGRSILDGGGGDWALSSVLFLPEIAMFTALDASLPFDVNGVLAVNAVVNVLALYGAIRLVAGRRVEGRTPVAWSVAALGVFCLLIAMESSPSRDALELASLMLTTTYYSAIVVAVVLAVGLCRRFLDRTRKGAALPVSLGMVAAVATLCNPLFAAWATVPLSLVLGGLCLTTLAVRRRSLALIAALVGGSILGFLGRIPFSAWIANSGAGYIQPAEWIHSAAYYADLAIDRLSSPGGVFGTVAVLALTLLAVVRTAHASDAGDRLVATAAWALPLVVLIGGIAAGTHAARYLQPLVFAPVLALLALPRVRMPRATLARVVPAVVAVVLLVVGAASVPRIVQAASAPDPDLACVTDWVDSSGRTGAGQFWTVRLPKLHAADPTRLVQVDHELRGYAWLVDRRDFAAGEVSFLIEDSQTVAWNLPTAAAPTAVIACGRYRILDYAPATLPLGPARS